MKPDKELEKVVEEFESLLLHYNAGRASEDEIIDFLNTYAQKRVEKALEEQRKRIVFALEDRYNEILGTDLDEDANGIVSAIAIIASLTPSKDKNNMNPHNLQKGDIIEVEQAWEDDAGNYHDEFAKIINIDPTTGELELDFYETSEKVRDFLSGCDGYFAKEFVKYHGDAGTLCKG